MSMPTPIIPGLYHQETEAAPRRKLRTGLPVFVAHVGTLMGVSQLVLSWAQFLTFYGVDGHELLGAAVRGFFSNGGELCYVYAMRTELDPMGALDEALEKVELLDDVDLICLPDLSEATSWFAALQQRVVEWCDAGAERFAILDTLPGASVVDAAQQVTQLKGRSAAVYFPWLAVDPFASSDVADSVDSRPALSAPPCGHIAGSYARNDRERGVFHSPANLLLSGLRGLNNDGVERAVTLRRVNELRVLPGRGVRVWGAQTIDSHDEWHHVSVRRLLLTLHRWLRRTLTEVAFEPNTPALWARVRRTVGSYLDDLYRRGALAGRSAAEAYYLRCDGTTNTPTTREGGMLIAEIGIAPVVPAEFIVVRLTYSAGELALGSASTLTSLKE